jgi:DNA-binding CsgD family transcriptional regulator
VLLVEGAAGVGKTRLLAEIRAQALGAGMRVGASRGMELERGFAFGVVRQLFEPLLADTDVAQQAQWWAGSARQAQAVFEQVTAPSVPPAGDFSVLHGLYWLTANVCQDRALALLIDDLQWCDVPSLRFLAYLLPRLEDLPVLVGAGLRDGEPGTDERLLTQITGDTAVRLLRPMPLSPQAAALLLAQALPDPVDPAFATACHSASGGNPLLLSQLARTLTSEHLTPTAANAHMVTGLDQTIAPLVHKRMARLPAGTVALARAVAVLGDPADPATAAALTTSLTAPQVGAEPGDPTGTSDWLEAAAALERLEILHLDQAPGSGAPAALSFVHPLVRSAIYHTLDHAERARAHQHAARLLINTRTDPERIAAHVLRIPPAQDPQVAQTLWDAATSALARGSPDSAYTYLRRCLQEPPAPENMLDVLIQTGTSALMTDTQAAVHPLRQALAQATDPGLRAQLRLALGGALLFQLRLEEGLEIYRAGLQEAPDEDSKRLLGAATLCAAVIAPSQLDLAAYTAEFALWAPDDSPGGHALDAALALARAWQTEPDAVIYAQRALRDDQLARLQGAEASLVCAWWALLAADEVGVLDNLNQVVARAHRNGSVRTIGPAYDYRGLGWLWQGQLSEAESDSYQAMRAIEAADLKVGRPFNGFMRAEEAMARGHLDDAADALQWAANGADPATDPGQWYLFLHAQAHLQRLRENYEQALHTAQLAGKCFAAQGGSNPAIVPWRSEAALNLFAQDRVREARVLASEEVTLARRWGAPRALGHALRIAGLTETGSQSIAMLTEAVAVLEESPAHLEHANALIDLGSALCRNNQRTTARGSLRKGVEIAQACGADLLVKQGTAELKISGARPRSTSITGPESLTPSERRIAELAATGKTNRQIAQQLFITPKTVEVHLSSIYRKLRIKVRTELPTALTPKTTPSSPDTSE